MARSSAGPGGHLAAYRSTVGNMIGRLAAVTDGSGQPGWHLPTATLSGGDVIAEG